MIIKINEDMVKIRRFVSKYQSRNHFTGKKKVKQLKHLKLMARTSNKMNC